MTVGERIRRRREALGWTQTELAQRSFVHRTTIVGIERGRRLPQFDTLADLAEVLQFSEADLTALAEDARSSRSAPKQP